MNLSSCTTGERLEAEQRLSSVSYDRGIVQSLFGEDFAVLANGGFREPGEFVDVKCKVADSGAL